MIWRFQRSISLRLLAWGLLSMVVGAAFWLSTESYRQGFGLQAALWGLIDILIALFGLRGLEGKLNQPFDPDLAAKDSERLRKLLWINAGLDILYMAGGLAMATTLGGTDAFALGSGRGIIVQGAFLFVFDLLHALDVPREVYLPDSGLFTSDLHDEYQHSGEKGMVILVHGFPGTPIEMRALGEAVQRAGWGVHGLLLPGFGKQIPSLFQQRAGLWSDYIANAVKAAQVGGQKVVLVGFSMGAGLSVPAAARTRPDGLVLIAPFWFDLTPLTYALVSAAGMLLPETFNPFKLIPARRIQQSNEFSPPPGHLYPSAPEFFSKLQDVQLPLLFLEQFAQLSLNLRRSASLLNGPQAGPLMVLQGAQDRVVRPKLTRKLTRLIGPNTPYKEIHGEHHVVMPDSPAFAQVCAEVLTFLKTVETP